MRRVQIEVTGKLTQIGGHQGGHQVGGESTEVQAEGRSSGRGGAKKRAVDAGSLGEAFEETMRMQSELNAKLSQKDSALELQAHERALLATLREEVGSIEVGR